jgi:hypothetical protein
MCGPSAVGVASILISNVTFQCLEKLPEAEAKGVGGEGRVGST